MRVVFYFVLAIHALIHIVGFVKAFQWYDFADITPPISKPMGLAWLTAGILVLATLITHYNAWPHWWKLALLGLMISQIIIILYWPDAKWGTLPNLILLLVALTGIGQQAFDTTVTRERKAMATRSQWAPTLQAVEDLPQSVQQWLHQSGVQEDKPISQVYLTQRAQMKMKPDQKNWYDATADQVFTTYPPAFHWTVTLQMNPLLPVRGRDQFASGQGAMQIKLWSLLPVVHVQNTPKINEGSLQRFLAEIVWFPSAARLPYITWEFIDETSARATLKWNDVSGSGVFTFDSEGRFLHFKTLRYMGDEPDAERRPWEVKALGYREVEGITIPVQLEATWHLDDGPWTWLKMSIDDVEYTYHKS